MPLNLHCAIEVRGVRWIYSGWRPWHNFNALDPTSKVHGKAPKRYKQSKPGPKSPIAGDSMGWMRVARLACPACRAGPVVYAAHSMKGQYGSCAACNIPPHWPWALAHMAQCELASKPGLGPVWHGHLLQPTPWTDLLVFMKKSWTWDRSAHETGSACCMQCLGSVWDPQGRS